MNKSISNKNSKFSLIKEQWFFLLIVVIIMSVITAFVNPNYINMSNITSILAQISVLGIVASGATILIISGNFDISVGAIIGLSTCIMAKMMSAEIPIFLAVCVGILVAIVCSLFNAACSILFKAPTFIISLASTGIFRGIALAFTEGTIQTIYGKFEVLGTDKLFNVIPYLFLISLLVYGIVFFILKKTKLGRRVYAIGNNARASYLSGIKVKANKLVFFGINGFLVGIAAMLLLSRVGAVQPSTGAGTELKAIGAVVIGGAPMTGGKGKIVGTFFGVLLMGVISNVLNMLRVNAYLQDIVFGVLVIVALAVSMIGQTSKESV
jgi:ribose transport system permease protein